MADAFVTPPPLEPGDEVAVVAPSSGGAAAAPHVLELGLRRLRETFDLRPAVHPTARQDDGFLRDHPRARAAAVHEAFRDPDVRGVVATIGGDDQLRVARHLDTGVLRAHPTRFYGMSDNTNLHLALSAAGVVSYYGGQLLNQIATPGHLPAYTERWCRRAFFGESLGELDAAERWTDDVVDWSNDAYATTEPEYEPAPGWTWRGGSEPAAGRLWGGCLEVLQWALAADRFVPEPAAVDGDVLLVETAEDLPDADAVKRAFMCLGERGLLERFDAVLVGRPQTRNRFEDPGAEAREEYRADQREAILGQLDRYNPDAPVVFDVDVGHTNPTAPLPHGARTVVDPTAERIAFE